MGRHGRSAREVLAGGRWAVQCRWAAHPSYLTYARRRHPLAVLGPETELVIEAYPRSANTFSTVAFQISQPRPVRLAHHLHAPAQIVAAARRKVPVMVPVRHPRDCAISVAIRSPSITLRQALVAYRHFHEAILPYRDACHVALFEDMVADFGRVVEGVNARFGTAFTPFEHTPENVARVYALIDERSHQPAHAAAIHQYVSGVIPEGELEAARLRAEPAPERRPNVEQRVARPSGERSDLQSRLREHYLEAALAGPREAAEAAYRRFAFGAGA